MSATTLFLLIALAGGLLLFLGMKAKSGIMIVLGALLLAVGGYGTGVLQL